MGARTGRLCILAGAVAACGEPSAPVRQAAYGFRQDALAFHWPADRLPVRYWAEPLAGPVRTYAERAIASWERQFLYGEFRGVLVSDSSRADVLLFVAVAPPPDAPLTDDPPVNACRGVTSVPLTDDRRAIGGPMVITLHWDPAFGGTSVANCLARVTTHEIGHSLGLFGHSPTPGDLMAAVPTAREPSANDRVTAQVLYHSPADLLPSERPR